MQLVCFDGISQILFLLMQPFALLISNIIRSTDLFLAVIFRLITSLEGKIYLLVDQFSL